MHVDTKYIVHRMRQIISKTWYNVIHSINMHRTNHAESSMRRIAAAQYSPNRTDQLIGLLDECAVTTRFFAVVFVVIAVVSVE